MTTLSNGADFWAAWFSNNETVYGQRGDDTLIGKGGNDQLHGGADDDFLIGNGGGDVLDGGSGVDEMYGEFGNDTYYVDDWWDTAQETSPTGGWDAIYTTVTYDLDAATSYWVEELHLVAGAGDIGGRGNEYDNWIYGNSGNNTLEGREGFDNLYGGEGDDSLDGGTDADQMEGGTGNDYYRVDNTGDTVIESAGDDYDVVYSSVTFTLSANVEALLLEESGSAIDGTGNNSSNTIIGNNRRNTLTGLDGVDNLYGEGGDDTLIAGRGDDWLYGNDGHDLLNGGPGDDNMMGGAGNDTYGVDSADDVVFELAYEGVDLVNAGGQLANYTLPGNVENLTLATAINGTGNALGNVITGNLLDNTLLGLSGSDTLSGFVGNDSLLGGSGNDVLNGGPGNDTLVGGENSDIFVFNIAPNASTNVDQIIDFNHTDDTIRLDSSVFTSLQPGVISPEEFIYGPAAQDASDHLIYNSFTGALLYDSDGSGAAAPIQFATVGAFIYLDYTDFIAL